jgi:exosortase
VANGGKYFGKLGQMPSLPWLKPHWPLLIGLVLVSIITGQSWSTEQGSHGPLVLASGLWLLFRMMGETNELHARPSAWQALGAIGLFAGFLVLFRLAAVIELEVYAFYGLYVAILFAFVGMHALRALWFPLLYLIFAVPVPDTLVALLTNPLKIWISESAVSLLYAAGYPIANAGVTIQIGQYQLLVAAACAGLNSLITLSALTVFYVYLSHRADWKYMLLLMVAVVPIAVFSNLVRVLALILITYHGGEAAAQGFFHNFAGLSTFAVSLTSIYLLDQLCQKLATKFGRSVGAEPTT